MRWNIHEICHSEEFARVKETFYEQRSSNTTIDHKNHTIWLLCILRLCPKWGGPDRYCSDPHSFTIKMFSVRPIWYFDGILLVEKRLGLISWNCLRNWWAGGTAPGCFAFDCSSHEFLVNQMFGPVFGSSQDLQRNTTYNRNTGGELTDTPFGTTCAWCHGTQTLFWARNKKCYPKKNKRMKTQGN
jgi:hypothetical protein